MELKELCLLIVGIARKNIVPVLILYSKLEDHYWRGVERSVYDSTKPTCINIILCKAVV